jgi:endo-1,4-beta-xylanase
MKTNLALVLSACVMATATVYGQNSAAALGLKDAYAGKFLIGCAGEMPGRYSPEELANVKTHYNIVTPENSMKPQPTHPSEYTYNFAGPDALVKWAAENNIKVWGHTLVWHAQTGRWFFQGTNGQPATRELAMERLRKHIMTVAGHYKGKVIGWDVVNESIADGGSGETENLRDSSWYRTVGPDVLTLAFKWAREADPNAELYYNDYNIEQGAVENRGKHASSLKLLKRLIAEGAPIQGVGIQGHWHLDTKLADVEKAIENYAALGLRVSITELDVTAIGRNTGAFQTDAGTNTVTAEAFQKQAEVYRKLFEIFTRHEKSIDRVTFWGISDRRSWRSRQKPLLFDTEMKPKPALQAILDVAKPAQP